MPFHNIIFLWRTITPTRATGLNKNDEQKQNQSYPGSLHIPYLHQLALILGVPVLVRDDVEI